MVDELSHTVTRRAHKNLNRSDMLAQSGSSVALFENGFAVVILYIV